MNPSLAITLAILGIALVLFLSERLSVDLIAMLVLVALGLTRVLSPQEVFSGFADPAVITIIAVFVLAHTLEITGVADQMGVLVARLAGKSEARLIAALMTTAALMSFFMNNIAVASTLLPAASTISRRSGIKIYRLLIPLAFGSLLGGSATLFTTTNIVVSGVLKNSGYAGFGVFDFLPVGLPIAVIGIAYMVLIGRRLLPTEKPTERSEVLRQAELDLLSTYKLGERLFRARIPTGSLLTGRTLSASTLREKYRLNVVAVERGEETLISPLPDFVLQPGDVMLLEGRLEEFQQLDTEPYLEIQPAPAYKESDLEPPGMVILEAVLSPRSQFISSTLKEAQFREKFGMVVLAVWNGERVIRTGLSDLRLSFGDALLLQGPLDRLPLLRASSDLIVLSQDEEPVEKLVHKSSLALTIFGLTLLVAALGVLPVGEVMLTGALVMIILNVMTMEQAYRVIDWRIVFLVAGMLPLGLAMTKTGATDLFAQALVGSAGRYGAHVLLLSLLALTVLLSQAMKGAAVSAVVAPIAIQAALKAGLDPRALCMGVALATSMAFITPLGHPVNILMLGPGGYTFRDFFKVGLPLTVLLFVVTLGVLPIFWPLAAK
ncbi:MAG: SLC13 family permease [Anaerolineae bacterium]|nr:SLC13 family permease [Anaerolineae bacterium]MCZ7553696.1 SLC13 family permease [Anaerolineales bacterium]